MESLRSELTEAYERAARYRRAKTLLFRLRDGEAELAKRQTACAAKTAAESEDVVKLESGGISGAFLKLFGTYDQRLDKERAELAAAQLKHAEATRALKEVRRQIEELEETLSALEGSEEAFKQLYARRMTLLAESGGAEAARIAELTRQIGQARAALREIDEAAHAGNETVALLNAAESDLEKAESWGTYDMLGGGLLASSIKYDHVDDASASALRAQIALDRFNAELKDIWIAPVGNVAMSDGLRFADMFLDGLISDWTAQRGIQDSLESVAGTKTDVSVALARLQSARANEENRLSTLEDALHKRVMEA